MAIERLSGGLTPADGADPRTFPAVWNETADDIEAGDYSKVPTGGSAGQVLVKQSGTAYDADWGAVPYANVYLPSLAAAQVAGAWVHPGAVFSSSGVRSVSADNVLYFPWIVHYPRTFDAVGFQVTTAGAAGATARVAIYRASADGQPFGAPVIDPGTFSVDSTGTKSAVLGSPVTLSQGGYVVLFGADESASYRRAGAHTETSIVFGSSALHSWTLHGVRADYTAFLSAAPTDPEPYTTTSGTTSFQDAIVFGREVLP